MPAGVGAVGSITVPGGGFKSARKATSPCALTTRRRNSLNVPPPGAGWRTAATSVRVGGSTVMCARTISSWLSPAVTSPRKATQPSPAAAGQPAKLGPAKTPPGSPGTGSPIAATSVFDAPGAGRGAKRTAAVARSARTAVRDPGRVDRGERVMQGRPLGGGARPPPWSNAGATGGLQRRAPSGAPAGSAARTAAVVQSCTARASGSESGHLAPPGRHRAPVHGARQVVEPNRRRPHTHDRQPVEGAGFDAEPLAVGEPKLDDDRARADVGVERDPGRRDAAVRAGAAEEALRLAARDGDGRDERAVRAQVERQPDARPWGRRRPALAGLRAAGVPPNDGERHVRRDEVGPPEPVLQVEERSRVGEAQHRAAVPDARRAAGGRRDGEAADAGGRLAPRALAREEEETARGREEEEAPAAAGVEAREPREPAARELEPPRDGRRRRAVGREGGRRRRAGPATAREERERRAAGGDEPRAPRPGPAKRDAELELHGVDARC